MDHSLGAFPLLGTPDSRRRLSIDHPGGSDHKLIERVLSIPAHKETYHAYLDAYLSTIFAEEKLDEQVTATAAFLRPLVASHGAASLERFEKVVAGGPQPGEPHVIQVFVEKRRQSVRDQLDGTSEGLVLHDGQPKSFPVRKIIGFAVALLVLMLLHAVGWIWGGIAGFRGSLKWGFLNLCFYPITPAIYGFRVRRPLGIRAASFILFGAVSVGVWLLAAIVSFT
jgi:hypothetical protein